MKRISTLFILCMTLLSTTIFAQTPKESLAKGVEIYNALREYSTTLTPTTITPENIKDIKDRVQRGTALLDKTVKEGTAEQIRAARYFKTNFQYQLGFIYGMKGDNKAGHVVFKAIENAMTTYKSTDFPLTYEYFDKIYKITWENFAATQAEYFTGMGEMSYNLGKYDDAYTMTKNSLAHKNITKWLSYIGVNKMLDIRVKQKNLVSDDEYRDFTLKSMKTYTALTDEDKKAVTENDYPTWERGYKIFNSLIENSPSSQIFTNQIGEAAQILRGYNEHEKAAKFYSYALKNNWGTATSWKNEVLPTAKSANDKALGLAVLGRLATAASATDCESLEAFARDYTQFGDATKAADFKKKGENCRQQRETEAKRAAEEKRRQEERIARERRKASRDGHFYVGINVFPLFSKPADLGGVVNFGAKKTMVELSFLNVTSKKENFFDLEVRDIKDVPEHRWDGYFTHLALKFSKEGMRHGAMQYAGLLFGYNQRTFEPFTSNVTTVATGKTVSKSFNPTSKQYIGMVNFGLMALNYFGIDGYMGIGAAYNKFDGGNSEVWNKDGLTIEDRMVANRKPSYVSFTMRMGISVGFGK